MTMMMILMIMLINIICVCLKTMTANDVVVTKIIIRITEKMS